MGFHTSHSKETNRGLCICWKVNVFITVPFEYRIGLGSYLGGGTGNECFEADIFHVPGGGKFPKRFFYS